MLEKELEKKVTSYARGLKILALKTQLPYQNGLPDRLYFKDGKYLWIEFKTTKGKLSLLQKHFIALIREQKGVVEVVRDVETGKNLLRKFFNI